MSAQLEHDDPDVRYRAMVEMLEQAAMSLRVQLEGARTARWLDRTQVLNSLHQRVRGMSLLLNAALGEDLARAVEDRRQQPPAGG